VESWLPVLVASVGSVLASSGFWTLLQRRDDKKDAINQVVLGLAYERIVSLGMFYINRGWITTGELGEYGKYFFYPYHALGGNGPAERIWDQVNKLPIQSHDRFKDIYEGSERVIENVPVISRASQEATPWG
jgi:hypothetical protein